MNIDNYFNHLQDRKEEVFQLPSMSTKLDDRDIFEKAFNQLSVTHQRMIDLKFNQLASNNVIASMMNMSVKSVVDHISIIIPYKLSEHYDDLKFIEDFDLGEINEDDSLIIHHFLLSEDVEVLKSLGIYTMKQLAKRYETKILSRSIVSSHLMMKIEDRLKNLRLIDQVEQDPFSTFEKYLSETFKCSKFSKEAFSVNRTTRYYGVAIGDNNCSIVLTRHSSEDRFSIRTELTERGTEFGEFVTIKEVNNLDETSALKALKKMLES